MSKATISARHTLTRQQVRDRNMYGIAVRDRVVHVDESDWTGTVTSISRNLVDVTTCHVHWDDEPAGVTDVMWTNKLRVREDV